MLMALMVDDDRVQKNYYSNATISLLTAAAKEHSPPTCTTIIVNTKNNAHTICQQASSVHRHKLIGKGYNFLNSRLAQTRGKLRPKYKIPDP